MNKTAILLVCMGHKPSYVEMTKLAVNSLRTKGQYKGDILLFSDHPELFDFADVRMVNVCEDEFLSRFPDLYNPNRHWGLLFRPFMGFYFDATEYEQVLYLDIDVLCDRPLAPILSAISKFHLHFTYAAAVSWLDESATTLDQRSPFLTKEFDISLLESSPIAQSSTSGVCSGVFGLYGSNFDDFMAPWRELILYLYKKGNVICDQMAFNECLLQKSIPGVAIPNKWIAYPLWGLVGREDLRDGKSLSGRSILYHFNPMSADIKLGYMKAFIAFGHLP